MRDTTPERVSPTETAQDVVNGVPVEDLIYQWARVIVRLGEERALGLENRESAFVKAAARRLLRGLEASREA